MSDDIAMLWRDILSAAQTSRRKPLARFFMGGIFFEDPLWRPMKRKIAKIKIKKIPKKIIPIHYSVGPEFPDVYLTGREADCVALLMHGENNPAIATRLKLSSRTVEYYIKNVRFKLNCHSRGHLIEIISKTEFVNSVSGILAKLLL